MGRELGPLMTAEKGGEEDEDGDGGDRFYEKEQLSSVAFLQLGVPFVEHHDQASVVVIESQKQVSRLFGKTRALEESDDFVATDPVITVQIDRRKYASKRSTCTDWFYVDIITTVRL
ncbi:hypothetical protein FF1_000504 [Malus domestica]